MATFELVNKVAQFCEAYSGFTFYPYQKQWAKRLIRSVLENDGAELTALFARQSGKSQSVAIVCGGLMILLPTLANLPMFAGDDRLESFVRGVMIGVFAPSQRQAQTTYNKIRGCLQSNNAQAILNDPEFRLVFTTSNGTTVVLNNGSFVTAISASEGSSIEGESFHIIICEECLPKGTKITTSNGEVKIEDVKEGDLVLSFNHRTKVVEEKRVTRSFNQPLYGRKMVNIYLDNGNTLRCTDNHKVYVSNKGYIRADSISESDHLLYYSLQNEKFWGERVKKVEIEKEQDIIVYDLTVEDNHNFFAESILVHNCQDISNFKLTKSIHPMGSAYNATLVKLGTSTTFKANFYDAIQRNKKEYKDGILKQKNHFEYNCVVASKYNPQYAKAVEQEKRRLGEKSLTGDRLVTVKIDGVVRLMPLEDLYSLYVKDGSNSKYLYPQNLEALSAKSGSILTDILDLKDYHLTDNQKPVIQALKSVDITKKGYRDKVSEITGIRKTKVEGIINTVRALLKAGSYYDLEPVWSPVTKIIRHECLEPIVKVSNGQGETVITEHHSLMAIQKSGLVEVTPKEASDLFRIRDIPDSVCMTSINFDELLKYNDEIYNTNSFTEIVIDGDYLKLISRRDKTPYVSFPRNIDVGSDTFSSLSRICGAYCSEGYVLQRDMVSGISVTDLDWIESLQADVKLVFNYDAPIVTSSKLNKGTGTSYKTMYRLCFNRKIIGIVLRHLCGQGSRHKKVPYFLFNVEPQHQLPFLNTLIEGDGHYDKRSNGLSYGTTSLSLACGYMYLQSRQGRQTQVHYNETNKIYQLRDCVAGTNNARGGFKVVNTDLSPEFVYDLEVEGTHNFVDSLGQVLVHNSDEFQMSYMLKWLLVRGMFVEMEDFEKRNILESYDYSLSDKTVTHVAGIDLGGASDSTVVTICEVDWGMPVVMESRIDKETGEEMSFTCYNTYLKGWLEISGVPNYEEQYPMILDYLNQFKVVRLVCDATREKSITDRLSANLPYEVIPYVFGSSSKSELYKHFEREILTGRVQIPGGDATKKTPEYLRYMEQLEDMEKSYRGAYMVVSHPKIKGAKDDYVDSHALAVWGCSFEGTVNETETRNSDYFYEDKPSQMLYKVRNNITAKRR